MESPDEMSISIVIPTHNRKEKLLRLIRSLLESTFPVKESDIIVVNDHSSDGSAEAVQGAFPNIMLINTTEEGFISKSRNIGIHASTGRYVFLVDDDNVVDRNCIKELVDTFLTDPTRSIGVVGPMMCYLEKPELIWCAGIRRDMATSLTRFIGRGEVDKGQYKDLMSSKDFPNSFMISREVIERVGVFDEVLFPIHYEEADLGERARQGGFKVVCNPRAKTWHDIPVPKKGDDKTRTHHLQNDIRAYYSGRNRVLFLKKYASPIKYLLFISLFNWPLTGYYFKIMLTARNKDRKVRVQLTRSYMNGIIDGMRIQTTHLPHRGVQTGEQNGGVVARGEDRSIEPEATTVRSMHLQIVTRFFLPIKAGVETHCYEVAKRIRQMDHGVTVYTRDDGFDKGGRLPPEETMEGFRVVRAPSNRALTGLLDFSEPIYLNNFDMSLTVSLYARALLSRLRGTKPKIWLVPHGGFTPYWGMFSLLRRSVKRIYHLTLGRYFINHLTCGVSALNGWEKDQLVKAGVDERLITIRTNGVEDIAFDLPPQRLEDHNLAWLSGKKYILMLCRVSREKNIDRVIEAISTQKDLSLIIGGSIQDQSYFDELNALISRNGTVDRVHFVGFVSGGKKYALIDGALALALISLYECDPIVVKESLARGIPVIASNVGSLPSMVLDGVDGFLAEQENVASISSAIAKVRALSPADRSKMEVNNRSKAIRYRWGTVTASLVSDIELCEGMRHG